jgi:hypothetical protein
MTGNKVFLLHYQNSIKAYQVPYMLEKGAIIQLLKFLQYFLKHSNKIIAIIRDFQSWPKYEDVKTDTLPDLLNYL